MVCLEIFFFVAKDDLKLNSWTQQYVSSSSLLCLYPRSNLCTQWHCRAHRRCCQSLGKTGKEMSSKWNSLTLHKGKQKLSTLEFINSAGLCFRHHTRHWDLDRKDPHRVSGALQMSHETMMKMILGSQVCVGRKQESYPLWDRAWGVPEEWDLRGGWDYFGEKSCVCRSGCFHLHLGIINK